MLTQDEKDSGVIHWHGHYQRPREVVLDLSHYDDVVRDEYLRKVLSSLLSTRVMLFIGCGSGGLSDPNLGTLLQEVSKIHCGKRYALTRAADEGQFGNVYDVRPEVYGEDYDELIPYLERLLDVSEATELPAAAAKPAELEHFVGAISARDTHGALFRICLPHYDKRFFELILRSEDGVHDCYTRFHCFSVPDAPDSVEVSIELASEGDIRRISAGQIITNERPDMRLQRLTAGDIVTTFLLVSPLDATKRVVLRDFIAGRSAAKLAYRSADGHSLMYLRPVKVSWWEQGKGIVPVQRREVTTQPTSEFAEALVFTFRGRV